MYVNRVQSVKLPTSPPHRPLPPVIELDATEMVEQLDWINRKLAAWAASDIDDRVLQLSALTLMHAERARNLLAAAIAGESARKRA